MQPDLVAPVSLVKFISSQYICVGVGGFLHLYNTQDGSKHTSHIFPDGKVYGIVIQGDKIVVFGQKQWKVYEYKAEDG